MAWLGASKERCNEDVLSLLFLSGRFCPLKKTSSACLTGRMCEVSRIFVISDKSTSPKNIDDVACLMFLVEDGCDDVHA